MTKFLIKLITIILPAVLIVWGLAVVADHYEQREPLRVRFQLGPYPEIDSPYRVVGVGNSHAASGFDFANYALPAINLSNVAQRFENDEAMLRQYHRQIAPGAVIVIDVSHIGFSHAPLTLEDGLQRNHYDNMSPFYIPKLNWGHYLQRQFLPFLVELSEIRQANKNRLTDQRAADAQEAWERYVRPAISGEATTAAQVVDQSPVAPALARDYTLASDIEAELAAPSQSPNVDRFVENMHYLFHKWYETDEFSPDNFEHNRQALQHLIDYAHQQNWRVVLVTIPVTQILEDGLLADYKQVYLYDQLDNSVNDEVIYLDYTQDRRLTDNLAFFGDADHLNQNGAKVFSYVLLQDLIERGYLPAEADGYYY